MDQSRGLLCQAIKHAAVYQCSESFLFLQSLVNISEKFKNKTQMESALAKIIPPNLRSKRMTEVSMTPAEQ